LFVVLAVMAAVVVSTASWWVPRVTSLVQSTPVDSTTAAPTAEIAPTMLADITALKARVAVLEQEAVNTVTPEALNTAKQEIAQRLSALETKAGVAQDGEAVTSLGESLSSQAKQLTTVSARLATLEAAIGNSARLEDLSNRLNMLEGRTAEAHSVLALSDRVTALETTARRTMVEQSANIALLMAVGQWRDALQAGRPFALELQTAKALAAKIGAATIDDSAFVATASKGLPTFADLQRQFGPAAAAAMRASAMPEGTSAWYRRILDRMLAIVTVRRLDGDAAGTSTAAILARAEARLNEGNLAAAVREMEGLSGDAAMAATAWQTQAKARVAAESAASDTTTQTVAAIAAADAAPATSATTTPSAATSTGQ
jgi:uroporphyrinogen-III synthase